MSYDFLVFDPAAPPRGDADFKAWYLDEMADRNGASSYEIETTAHPSLRAFYTEMRQMFTPFNGPDDVPLPDDAPQVRILRTCEFSIRPHSIYMSFRWPAQDMARAASSTLAKALDLGYYHVSATHGQAVFPDGQTVWPTGRYSGHGAGKARS